MSDPTPQFTAQLSCWVNKGLQLHILNKKEAHYLIPRAPRIPVLYILPKIHKCKEKPPGRPIVSGIGSLYSRVGEYLDIYLQPLVTCGQSYLKDSRALIQSLQGITISSNTLLVTIDIESLYTNIKQQDALVAVKLALMDQSKLKLLQIEFLVEGLKLAMGNNYFWAHHQFYNQVKGVAMGARYAPSVANIVLNKWEQETIYHQPSKSLKYYKRYIDDVILLWEGTMSDFQEFLLSLNNNTYGLRFTAESSWDTINYLDLTLTKQGNRLVSKTFFKATDRNGFVPVNSCHHPQWLGAVPKGQYMRIRRNCDDITDYHTQSEILTNRFQEKGYPLKNLIKTKNQVLAMNRDSLLVPKEKAPFLGDISFISGFHRQYEGVEKIFHKYWPILCKDRDLQNVLPPKPKFIYRRAPGLRNMIALNVPDSPKKPSTFLDGSGFHYCTRCKACRTTNRVGKKISKFHSKVTRQEFSIKPLITCNSSYVTYVLECPCSIQYVGRTTRKLRVRINEHVANISKGFLNHSVSRHFRMVHNRDPRLLTFYGIDKIASNWRGTDLKKAVSQNETQWLYRLQTMQPQGLNIELDLNCFLTND